MTVSDDTIAKADTYKSLGNKHMANKDYEDAYEAYSTALSLVPLGPSSHIYLSNRSAALLSLRRYSAAAVDARRAITLAPTFGKAHARLGQSLYFLKDYAGAVAAYENAYQFEPENQVTWTYLNKAKKKFARQEEKRRMKAEDIQYYNAWGNDIKDDRSVAETEDLANMALTVTDGDTRGNAAGVLRSDDNHYDDNAQNVSNGAHLDGIQAALLNDSHQDEEHEADPDFDEALRLQEFGIINLHKKNYRKAMEEFSAALFLVPDDEHLTPQLYVGRAHALNGLQRHEGALNDAMMALSRDKNSADAYVVLARSHFYLNNFEDAVQCFEKAKDCMDGDHLSPLDKIYLDKANEYMEVSSIEFDDNRSSAFSASKKTMSKPVPKLKPPRFVSRQELLNSGSNLPSLPKAFHSQLPQLPTTLKVGPERKVLFLSESMGVKLNRGPDGVVRVLSVTSPIENRAIKRQGEINKGDIIREAAGVDLRRPLTNVMWSDTVALLKISPRPMLLIVAREMSKPPVAVQEEFEKVNKNISRPASYHPNQGYKLSPPSFSECSQSVSETKQMIDEMSREVLVNSSEPDMSVDIVDLNEHSYQGCPENSIGDEESSSDVSYHSQEKGDSICMLFPLDSLNSRNLAGYTAQTWRDEEGSRRLRFHCSVSRCVEGRFFWSSHKYLPRMFHLYENPDILLISRPPLNDSEMNSALDAYSWLQNDPSDCYMFAESIVFSSTCKLKLSRLTTPTSVSTYSQSVSDDDDLINRSSDPISISSFEIIAPSERIILSVILDMEEHLSLKDRHVFSETGRVEREIIKSITFSNRDLNGVANSSNLSWMHSVILGTIHSHVVCGNIDALSHTLLDKGPPQDTVDQRDREGYTPLHYACFSKSTRAVSILLKAGADPSLPTISGWKSPCHICAELLEPSCLELICSSKGRQQADPNALDGDFSTPMNVIITKYATQREKRDISSIKKCLSVLRSWGGDFVTLQLDESNSKTNPILALSRLFDHELLDIVFDFCNYGFSSHDQCREKSIGSTFQYPIHSCFLSFWDTFRNMDEHLLFSSQITVLSVTRTLEVLLRRGLEPNERIQYSVDLNSSLKRYLGYTPIQILAAAAQDLIKQEGCLTDGESLPNEYKLQSEILISCADILSEHGARIWIDAPVHTRIGVPYDGSLESEVGSLIDTIDPNTLNFEKNKSLIQKLGGTEKLAASRARWLKEKSLVGNFTFSLLQGKGLNILIENSKDPGGSNDKSCAICWKPFGSIVNRKHICRASRRYVCEDCSSKTVILHGEPRRVSDGQFNSAKFSSMEMMKKEQEANTMKLEEHSKKLDAREDLFGSVSKAVKNMFMDESEADCKSSTIESISTLNKTRDALMERGEKLGTLVEKTSALNDASVEFKNMAKMLADSQERRFFW